MIDSKKQLNTVRASHKSSLIVLQIKTKNPYPTKWCDALISIEISKSFFFLLLLLFFLHKRISLDDLLWYHLLSITCERRHPKAKAHTYISISSWWFMWKCVARVLCLRAYRPTDMFTENIWVSIDNCCIIAILLIETMCSHVCVIIMFNYYTLQICLNVKKARNRYNSDERETKEIEVVFRVYLCVLEHKKEIDYIKRNDFKLNIFPGGFYWLHITW